jgi:hypothetical protein
MILVPGQTQASTVEMITIDPRDLQAALARDESHQKNNLPKSE